MDEKPKPAPADHRAVLDPPRSVEEAPVWLARLLQWAHERRVTDLHLFPSDGRAMVWARIDGELREVACYSPSVHERIVARLKVLGRCSDYTGELVQEGRFTLNGHAEQGEARLSVLPTLRGEKAVVRLLEGGTRLRRLDELGISETLAESLRRAVDRPQGVVLAVGPSGCGKSTALYALLRDLNERTGRPVSIVTIEDPIEQSMPFAAQISADPHRGLGFAEGLRAVVRQDPEVIMIGEIRDAETAKTALEAALTGHRLLSSMHTLTAGEALVRLRQMGAPPYVISSALAGVLNVRLVRLLCQACRKAHSPTESDLALAPEAASWPEARVAEPVGCEDCLGSGHQGRIGTGEWLVPTGRTTLVLQSAAPAPEVAASMETVVPAREAVLELVRSGRVALGEMERLSGLTSLRGGERTAT